MPRRKRKTSLLTPTKSTKTEEGFLVFENFKSGTIFRKEVLPENVDNYHAVVIGAPYLYKHISGEYISGVDTPYPLLSALPTSLIPLATGDGKVVFLLRPTTPNDGRFFYVATTTGRVKAMKIDGVARDLGQPKANPTNPYETSLAIYTDKIFFVHPSATSIYHIPETTTGTTWTAVGGFNSPKFATTFSFYLYIADKNSASDPNRRLVRVLNTSYTILGSLDLGGNWDVIDISNNNERFLVVYAQPYGIKAGQVAFLWDGGYQNRPFHVLRLPGYYVGSVNYMGAYLIFLQVGTSLNVYELSGFALKFIDSFPAVQIDDTALPSQRFSVWGNYIFMSSLKQGSGYPDISLETKIPVYNILEKELIFLPLITDPPLSSGAKCVLVTSDLNNNLRVIGAPDVADKVVSILFLPDGIFDVYENNTAVPYQTGKTAEYYSNIINFIRPVKINRVDVYYGRPPTDSRDYWQIELHSINENTNETFDALFRIDINSQSNYMRFDNVGLIGNKFVMFAKLYNISGKFRGNLKRVIINFSYLNAS